MNNEKIEGTDATDDGSAVEENPTTEKEEVEAGSVVEENPITEQEEVEAGSAVEENPITEQEKVVAVTDESSTELPPQNVETTADGEEVEEEIELWNDQETKSAIEALLFVSEDPLTKNELAKLVKNADKTTINRAITQLSLEYTGERGIHLSEIDGGFQFRTNPDLSEVILRMYEVKPLRLSKAILETLAIVAYQQPVTKARADEIRGVDCSGSLKKLIGYDLVSVIGRADDIGRPNLYATTTRFLEFFGMNSITDMPTLEEFEVDALELVGEDLREFLPEDDRESILAGHVSEGAIERQERTHELGDGAPSDDEEDKTEQVEVYPSSAANDDGVLKEEEE